MEEYKIWIKFKYSIFKKKYNAIGHYFTNNKHNNIVITLKDKTDYIFNMKNIKEIKFDKELWYIKKNKLKKEANNGGATISLNE